MRRAGERDVSCGSLILPMPSMKTIRRSPPHMTMFSIVLLQGVVVVGGTMFVSLATASNYYDFPESGTEEFSKQSLFIRHYGMALLVVPALWAAAAVYSVRKPAPRYFQIALLAIGDVSVLVGIVFYLWCAMTANLHRYAYEKPGEVVEAFSSMS